MRKRLHNAPWFASVTLALGLLAGCVNPGPGRPAATQPAPAATAERLRVRAEALWTARVREDWAATLDFQRPTERAKIDPEAWIEWHKRNEPLVIQRYELGAVVTDGPLGWVQVKYTSSVRKFPAIAPREAERWECWRAVDGVWYPLGPREDDTMPQAPVLRNAAEEQRLRSRWEAAWAARQARDWAALYALTDPADHETVTLEMLAQDEDAFTHTSADLQWVEVLGERDRGRVCVIYRAKFNDPSLQKAPAQQFVQIEPWVRREGQWYRELVTTGP